MRWCGKRFNVLTRCTMSLVNGEQRPYTDALDPTGRRLSLREAVSLLSGRVLSGDVVALPSDTVYGLACRAQCPRSVARAYRAKGRDPGKPLAVCLRGVREVSGLCHVSVPDEVLQDLLPGPVTLVFRRKPELNPELNPTTQLVGVRVPDHELLRALCEQLREPIALTSANSSDGPSSLRVQEFRELWGSLGVVLDAGSLGDPSDPASRLGSTVIDLSVPGSFRIIRAGVACDRTLEILQKKHGLKLDSGTG